MGLGFWPCWNYEAKEKEYHNFAEFPGRNPFFLWNSEFPKVKWQTQKFLAFFKNVLQAYLKHLLKTDSVIMLEILTMRYITTKLKFSNMCGI